MLKVLPHLIRTFEISISDTQRGGSLGSSAADGGHSGKGGWYWGWGVGEWMMGKVFGEDVEGEIVVKSITGEKGEEIGRKEVRVLIGRKGVALVNGLDVEIEVRE
jgi:hypothetical protein